ncbi:hypothetical protein ABEP42_27720 [Priestia megaterium]
MLELKSLALHNAYHIGQIVFLSKMQGAKQEYFYVHRELEKILAKLGRETQLLKKLHYLYSYSIIEALRG